MMDQAQSKQDEQYPLLKVEGGGGDSGYSQSPSTVVAPAWGVNCPPKQSWLSRWPELFSACWMTLILLGISFLVFYALGMSAYRRQPIIVMKCNETKPASDVYYYQIIQHGVCVPFALYSDYISTMATQYPSLRINIIFLLDDSLPANFHSSKHSRFINNLIPYASVSYKMRLEENNKREIRDFQSKHPNVNVSFMPLSKFMAKTPLKFKWRMIPPTYLPFYARVFSVWQNGGIGMDLTTFNDQFNNHRCIDRKVSAILTQHNDGIKPENYASSLQAIEREEENDILTAFYTIYQQILNETRSFLNRSLSFYPLTTESSVPKNIPLIRTHRDKRQVVKNPANENNSSVNFLNVTNKNDSIKNTSIIDLDSSKSKAITLATNITAKDNNKGIPPSGNQYASEINSSNIPQMVLFYDFSIISDGLGPSYLLPDVAIKSDIIEAPKNSAFTQFVKRTPPASRVLSIHPEGIFFAASSRLHPFLGHLLTSGCQRMHPKFVIQDVLLTQCSGSFKDDAYCNNIYIL
ncbi:uncharacterized protein LOC115440423 [Manduca sexta]|uniref:Uncharacterized protein n=1 Tax=Manduca sexta TaxID=7130 RepID=A0A921YUC7_MANSE|nr:uncharacterized protein LOC115440423 [Manduca sexta]KAG6445320.1 hypothetical protein O3G_MSEX003871 [Manduca sexta]